MRGTPGHGSAPFRGDNALVKAAGVVQRLAEYRPAPRFHELWPSRVASLDIPDEFKDVLLDPAQIDDVLDNLPSVGAASHLHACTHTTFSPNLVDGNPSGDGRMKVNVIPDTVVIEVDIRTLPGEGPDEVDAHLRAALGDLADHVEVEAIMNDAASISRTDTPLWDSLQRAVNVPFPTATLSPQFIVGFTDARVYRDLGADRLRRRAVQPVARRHRVRLTLPRPQRTHRRRVAVAHHAVLPRRRHRSTGMRPGSRRAEVRAGGGPRLGVAEGGAQQVGIGPRAGGRRHRRRGLR